MIRFTPLALLFPVVAGCCCCGSWDTSGTHVAVEELSGVKSLTVDGLATAEITVGSEPYSISSESFGGTSEVNGSELIFSIGLGEGTASLPQLDAVTIAEGASINLSGVDVADLTITKATLGSATVSGKATNVTVDVDSNSVVDLSGLTAENVTLNATGNDSVVKVHATSTLTVNATGDGNDISYSGGATLTDNSTGSNTVTNLDEDSGTTTEEADGSDADGAEPVDGTADGELPALNGANGEGLPPEPTILDGEGFDGGASLPEEPLILDGEGFAAPSSATPNAIGD